MPKPTTCLKIPKKQGEKTIALANKLGLMDKMQGIQRDQNNLCIPLIRQPRENELKALKSQVPEIEVSTSVFIEKQPPPQTLMQILESKLPPHLLASLPQALDVIGDIAIVEIPPELKPQEPLIAQYLQKRAPSVEPTARAISPSLLAKTKLARYTASSAANTMLTWQKRIFRLGSRMNTNVWHHSCKMAKPWWTYSLGLDLSQCS
jgi:hypothetical protein